MPPPKQEPQEIDADESLQFDLNGEDIQEQLVSYWDSQRFSASFFEKRISL